MLHMIHEAGHKYLKVLFLLACAGSSTLFFAGAALPTPPTPVVLGVSIALGLAVEWGYCTFSCDLTEAITEGNRGGMLHQPGLHADRRGGLLVPFHQCGD